VERSEDYRRFFVDGEPDVYVYSRIHNPTVRNVEERLAQLELADDAVLFSSGMAAVAASIMALARSGDTVVAVRPLYGGTVHFLTEVMPRYGIDLVMLDPDEVYALERYAPDARVVFFETPANPTLLCVSIAKAVQAARRVGALTIIDNTFASPINQNPLVMGVDVVLHSATKFIGGHSDVIAGAVMTSSEWMAPIRENLMVFGGCIAPFDAFLLDRSLKTLPLRMAHHNASAQTIAEFFANERRVERVYYPGLRGTPDYAIASEQMTGFGGVLAIDLENGAAAMRFCDSLEIALNAVSLGGVETLVTIPAISTHAKVSEDEKRAARIHDGTVRISIGLEDLNDLIADFEHALAVI
jgi:cystathionine beta-lyase/cystathionine gamma-synthase